MSVPWHVTKHTPGIQHYGRQLEHTVTTAVSNCAASLAVPSQTSCQEGNAVKYADSAQCETVPQPAVGCWQWQTQQVCRQLLTKDDKSTARPEASAGRAIQLNNAGIASPERYARE